MEIISLSGQSRGSNASELTQRSWGAGWEVSPTNLENIAKLQSRTQPGKALLGPQPSGQPWHKAQLPSLPQQSQAMVKRPLPKIPNPRSPLLQQCCSLFLSHWGDCQPCRAHPVQWQGLREGREVLLSSSASQGMEKQKHPKVGKEQQGDRAIPVPLPCPEQQGMAPRQG